MFSLKERKSANFNNMVEPRSHYAKEDKPGAERQALHHLTHMESKKARLLRSRE